MLIPHFREELEKKLIEEAKNCVAEKCGEALAKRIETTGFRPMDMHEEEDLEFTRMVSLFFIIFRILDGFLGRNSSNGHCLPG